MFIYLLFIHFCTMKTQSNTKKVTFYNTIQQTNTTKRLTRSPELLCKKGVLENFAKLREKVCDGVSFLIKFYWKRDFNTDVYL